MLLNVGIPAPAGRAGAVTSENAFGPESEVTASKTVPILWMTAVKHK